MSSHRGHQKRLEKKKKQRLATRAAARAESSPTSLNGLLRLASTSPFGPGFMSSTWRSDEPELVTVIAPRLLADGSVIAGIALVDRTCLGVKNSFARHLTSRSDLAVLVESVGAAHDGEMEEVSILATVPASLTAMVAMRG